MFVYESHMGGFFVSDEELSYEECSCEVCGDRDWLFIKLIVDYLDEKDIMEFREQDIVFKVLFNRDKAYILLRFGNSSLLHEILFNPTLYAVS